MLFHALTAPEIFLLFLSKCVQVGKLKFALTCISLAGPALENSPPLDGLTGGLSRAGGYFWEEFENNASRGLSADSEFCWQILPWSVK